MGSAVERSPQKTYEFVWHRNPLRYSHHSLFSWQNGKLRHTRHPAGPEFLQRGEPKEPCGRWSKRNFLKHRIVLDVFKPGRVDIDRPGLSVHTCFEAICFDDAFMRAVLARKIRESRDPLRTSHVDCDLVRRCRGRIGTSDPECRRIAVNRIGCRVIVVLAIDMHTTSRSGERSGAEIGRAN